MARHRFAKLLLVPLLCLAPAAGGCGSDDDGGSAPQISPLSDKTASVDQEFTLEVSATDKDGDPLKFGFKSTIADIGTRADLRQAGNMAVFRWTPIASDVGIHSFTFTVSDGKNTAKETITIEVTIQAGSSNAPIFRKPLGTGTTLDLTQKKCIDVEVLVEDSDSPGVSISQEDPVIAGATLDQRDGLGGVWNWCPSKEQISEGDRYALKLLADDGDNQPTTKNFLIVLRKAQKADCPGDAPVVEHTPEGSVSSMIGLTIDARVTDDQGIKYEPLVYYSFEQPSEPPDLAQMTQVTMMAMDGDMKDGHWAADVPNPVAGKPEGTVGDVYYVIVAQDNDDKDGDCDHLTQSPETGTHHVQVTNPGGSGGLGLCKPCTADVQCGAEGDLCAILGTAGKTYCFRSCTGEGDCPGDYACSDPITSVDGVTARQCIPKSGVCEGGGGGTCEDDSWEPNDTIAEAADKPGLSTGDTSALVSCPGSVSADEDWYPIDTTESGTLSVMLDGGDASDLDLAILDGAGTVLGKSEGLESFEFVESCQPPGTYYVRVYSWQNNQNTYSLMYDFVPGACTTCSDDDSEPDDNASQAREVDISAGAFKSDTNAICSWNEDWYSVYLFANETLYASIAFDQASSKEDLDIILYQGTTNLTPCDETTSTGCDQENGQSWTSNENLTWQITEGGLYYVVVRGFDGAENLYDICVGLEQAHCPKL